MRDYYARSPAPLYLTAAAAGTARLHHLRGDAWEPGCGRTGACRPNVDGVLFGYALPVTDLTSQKQPPCACAWTRHVRLLLRN